MRLLGRFCVSAEPHCGYATSAKPMPPHLQWRGFADVADVPLKKVIPEYLSTLCNRTVAHGNEKAPAEPWVAVFASRTSATSAKPPAAGYPQGYPQENTPTLDPDHVAALTVDALHAAGWRHIPRPQPLTGTGRKDPATAHRGADRVREALGLTRPEGDQP